MNTSKTRTALGFPDRYLTKMEYRMNKVVGNNPPYTNTWDWRLNSIYDPDYTGTGHQPMWYDQFSALYRKYRVYAVAYEFKVATQYGNAPAEFVLMATPALTSSPSSIVAMREQNRTLDRMLPATPDKVAVMRGKVSLPNLMGETGVVYRGNDKNAANFGANPLNDPGLRLVADTYNGSEAQWVVDAKLTYFVELFDRINPLPS